MKLPVGLVLSLFSFTIGFGGTIAVAGAKQAEAMEKISVQQVKIDGLEKESQQNRERVLRIEILSEQTNKAVERIEKKLDHAR